MRDDGDAAIDTSGDTLGSSDTLAPSETIGSSRTLGPAEASLQPSTERIRPPQPTVDFDELVIVDPTHYAVRGELARGGMGRIMEARDLRLGRKVAIKEVLDHDETALARFEREARITARLDHPGIVHVHEAGRWPSGQPFYVMKFIRGEPLDRRIARAKTLRDRLALLPTLIAAVDALAYAHAERVIHRDLKPSNILVGEFGETIVIDWGLAKDLSIDERDDVSAGPYRKVAKSSETVAGSIVGTPAYMPPEQARGEPLDARADVYALGAILYQVLAGAAPYTGRTTDELLAKVIDASPTPLAEREPDVPADLLAIVETAMARAPADRYATAQDMAVELKRFQTGQLVTSHRYTRWELVARFARRHRAAVTVASIALVLLAAIGIASIVKIVEERDRADLAAQLAQARADEGTLARASAALDTDPTQALALLEQLSPGAPEWRGARMIAADAAARGLSIAFGRDRPVLRLVIDRDGKQLAALEPGAVVRVWDLTTRTDRELKFPAELFDYVIVDGAIVAVDANGAVWRWPLGAAAATQIGAIEAADASVRLVLLSPDARHAVVFERMGETRLVELATKRATRLASRYATGEWEADGRRVLLYDRGELGRLDRLDVATKQVQVVRADAQALTFAAGHGRVWLATYRGQLHEVTTGRVVDVGEAPNMLAVLPDGSVVSIDDEAGAAVIARTLAGSHKGEYRAVDAAHVSRSDYAVVVSDGTPVGHARLRGHGEQPQALAVTPDGRIITGDRGGQIRIWRRQPVHRDHGDGHTTSFHAALSPDRTQLVLARRGPVLEVRELATGAVRLLRPTVFPPGYEHEPPMQHQRLVRVGKSARVVEEIIHGPDHEVRVLAASRSGKRYVTLDEKGEVAVWDIASGHGTVIATDVVHVAISPDGDHIALAKADRALELYFANQRQRTTLGTFETTALAFAPDNLLAIATLQKNVLLFRGNQGIPLETGEDIYRALAFSPDGKLLVGGGDQWRVRAWNLATHDVRTWSGHAGTITSVVFGGGGDRVATAAADLTVRVWNVGDGSSHVLRGHTDFVSSIALAHDDLVVTGSVDQTARVWDLQSGLSRTLAGHEDAIVLATYGPRNQHVLVVDRFHQIAQYPDQLPYDELSLRAWLAAARRAE